MDAARGILYGLDGTVSHIDNAIAIGKHARAALRIGRDGAVADGRAAAGGQHRRAHAVKAGTVAACAVVGYAANLRVLNRRFARGHMHGVFIRAGGFNRAGQRRILGQGVHRCILAGRAALTARPAHAVGRVAHAVRRRTHTVRRIACRHVRRIAALPGRRRALGFGGRFSQRAYADSQQSHGYQ